ncbi:hypothetical protein LCGC14_1247290 [marine sediment metagenome]|uniref:Uncharacterized protein n=1 Tax=marine sediment metagenome TaxID=412755 RepID=A0A0F9LR16_9ZZZZ
MFAKLCIVLRIYRKETRIDWVILGANAAGGIAVTVAFFQARMPDTVIDIPMQIASTGF